MSPTAATYRRILTSFWTDPDIRRNVREPDAKVVLLYLFTCPDSTLSGLYFQPLDYVAAHTCVPLERVQELVERFNGRYLTYDSETEEVFVHAAWKHNVGGEWRPKDNRTRALLRQIADTHSDRLVSCLVEEYPEWEWPSEVTERAAKATSFPQPDPPGGGEAPSKPLPSQNHANPHDEANASKERGLEATHAVAHAVTHADITNPSSTTSPVAERRTPGSEATAAGSNQSSRDPEQNRDDELWREIRDAAHYELGMNNLTPSQENSNRNILTKWRYEEERDPITVLAAIRGSCLLREKGASWVGRDEPAGLATLVKAMVLYEQGDGRAMRPLYAVAVERWRREQEAGSRDRRTSPTGPTRASKLLPHLTGSDAA